MKKNVIYSLIPLLFAIQSCFAQNKTMDEVNYLDDTFEAGQTWRYHTRNGENNSTLTIVKVEKLKNDTIIHIALSGLKIKHPLVKSGVSESIDHLPFSKEAILNSVIEQIGSQSQLPDFMEGYVQWKEAYESGNGGIFTITVKEAVGYVEQTMNK
ncbi:hypothetical protein D770_04980 [Flammeovirgaceae bacterium 311]|nr:hypothetical protein D770_04980 [Flammeovirgaceae bacterium 311]